MSTSTDNGFRQVGDRAHRDGVRHAERLYPAVLPTVYCPPPDVERCVAALAPNQGAVEPGRMGRAR